VRHGGTGGVARRYLKAYACDPISAFGGVLAFNSVVDAAAAEEVAKLFVECIVAPGFDEKAKAIFAAKKICGYWSCRRAAWNRKRNCSSSAYCGGMLVQQPDLGELRDAELRAVTKRVPTAEEMRTMRLRGKFPST